ncbi:hypothetical protein VNO77_15592 [Canavalia gladiata]|uniref:AAA+ ATPase domain-containing protein n=1 Tax=Canavalia gladiata TaxID=3824 RepID=A0AAN9M2V0_CANGL
MGKRKGLQDILRSRVELCKSTYPTVDEIITHLRSTYPDYQRTKHQTLMRLVEETLHQSEEDENLSGKRRRKIDEGEEERFTSSCDEREDFGTVPTVETSSDLMKTMLRESYMEKNVELERVKATTNNMNEDEGSVGEVKRFRDLGGMKEILEELKREVLLPLHHPHVLKELGVRKQIISGILLHGPPGCGKTTLAHAIANETALPFYPISAPELVSPVSGESEGNIRDLFSKAYRTAPSIIFIDEIDAIASKVENSQRGMEKRVLKQLLTCMCQPVGTRSGNVLVIASTNSPDALDPALRRPGRFDREIFIGIPDESAREDILSAGFRSHKLHGPIDLRKIARSTGGFVAADLDHLIYQAAIVAMNRIPIQRNLMRECLHGDWEREPWSQKEVNEVAITMSDIEEAIKMVQPSTRREGFSSIPHVKWEELGGMDLIRQEFEDHIVGRIQDPEDYEGFGLNLETGFLLYGPPGCGKTTIAKAVANAAGANFIHVKGPELLNKYVGESERDVRMLFRRARTSAPCIIFFDEVEALTTKRGKEGGWVTERLLNQLLIELDGAEQSKGVFVIGATNRPEMIDPAILRPGRLGKLLYVPLPSPEERVLILKTIARKMPIDAGVDLNAIGRMEACENMSGADLHELMKEALLAFHKEKRASTDTNCDTLTIKKHHLDKALSKVFPSVSDSQRLYYQHLSERFSPCFRRSAMERNGKGKEERRYMEKSGKDGGRRKNSMGHSKSSSGHRRQENCKEDKHEILAPTFAHDPLR